MALDAYRLQGQHSPTGSRQSFTLPLLDNRLWGGSQRRLPVVTRWAKRPMIAQGARPCNSPGALPASLYCLTQILVTLKWNGDFDLPRWYNTCRWQNHGL